MKNARVNIPHFGFILFNPGILGEWSLSIRIALMNFKTVS